MRRFFIPVSLLALTSIVARADLLVFMNGDRIPGHLAGGQGSDHLLWKPSPDATPISIPISAIHKVELDEKPSPEDAEQNVSLLLSNNDSLHGRLLSLGDSSLSLESPSFGRLEIPRSMIQDLGVSEGGYYLLSGAGKSKDWYVDRKGSWRVLDGVISSHGYGVLGRELAKSSRLRMDFDITTKDSGVGFTVHLFATNKQTPAEDANYAILFSGSYVYARKTSMNAEHAGIFGKGGGKTQEAIGEPQRLERAPGQTPLHITILADGRSGRIILLVDGQQIQQWDDPRGFGDKCGSAIGFASNGQNVELRNLTVARWDGASGAASKQPQDFENETDIVHTTNDDEISGLVAGVKDGALSIESKHFGSLALPTNRIQRVQLTALDREKSRRMQGDVRASFQKGGQLTLRLASLDNEKLTGFSENTGNASLLTSSLRQIVFNIYEDKFPDPDAVNTRDAIRLLESEW